MVSKSDHTNYSILWDNLRAGDKNAFNNLFRKYYTELYYYGIKIFSDTDLIDECIQEVFVRIWETRANLSDVKNIRSYLFVSLRRMILLKKNKRINSVDITQFESFSFFFEENEFEKHNEISEEVRKVLLKAVNSLTKKQRELIMLFFYHELSYAEVSEVMDISIQSARNLMYRTLIRLRESLGSESIKSIQNILFLLFSSVSKK